MRFRDNIQTKSFLEFLADIHYIDTSKYYAGLNAKGEVIFFSLPGERKIVDMLLGFNINSLKRACDEYSKDELLIMASEQDAHKGLEGGKSRLVGLENFVEVLKSINELASKSYFPK